MEAPDISESPFGYSYERAVEIMETGGVAFEKLETVGAENIKAVRLQFQRMCQLTTRLVNIVQSEFRKVDGNSDATEEQKAGLLARAEQVQSILKGFGDLMAALMEKLQVSRRVFGFQQEVSAGQVAQRLADQWQTLPGDKRNYSSNLQSLLDTIHSLQSGQFVSSLDERKEVIADILGDLQAVAE